MKLKAMFLWLIVAILATSVFSQAVSDLEGMKKAVQEHNKAIHPFDTWMRDPYIMIGPDGNYYLTATHHTDTHQIEAPVWKSKDLIHWEHIGFPYSIAMASNYTEYKERMKSRSQKDIKLWAPELHYINNRWILVHTSNTGLGNLAISKSSELDGQWDDWGTRFQRHHDPTLFVDENKSIYMLARCTEIGKLKADLSDYEWEPKRVSPSNRKMGHEGVFMVKIENKYVLFGTAWSRDKLRHGTYNLYYTTADKPDGPFGPRRFAGRFLGHGSPFKDKQGRWWCTAFYNANHPPLDPEEAKTKDVSQSAYTINRQGLTIVPMEIKMVDGDVVVYAKDPDYRSPGPEEMQKF